MVAVKLGMLANGFTSQGVVLATLTLALAEVAGTPEGLRRSVGCWWRADGAQTCSWRRDSGASRTGSGVGE